ncbi:MAG: TonB-dependent receptor [Marinilabiliaceae bacterium]|nr:TonB-dependent receptor [Marinilabiliaceae bacterium]
MKKKCIIKPPAFGVGGTKLTRVMKLVSIFLLVFSLHLTAGVSGQKKVVNLRIKNGTIVDVLNAIEKQTDFRFAYSSEFVDLDKRVSVNVQQEEIGKVLDEVLLGTNYLYRWQDNFIIFIPAEKEVVKDNPQEKDVTVAGKITDAQGDPLPGVNVFEKSQPTHGVITGIDGSYSIVVSSADAVLTYSFIGFVTQEINVAGRTSLNINLVEEMTGLDEVVVVGYGTQKKVNLTGSVANVEKDMIKNRTSATNVTQMLQGLLPGITVKNTPNGEGGSATITIRGKGNLESASPLYVVDGIIVDAAFFERLDPNNIEDISFLKDAASASIYGSRAAYGVILVKTKTGGSEEMKVNYNFSYSIKDFIFMPEYVNSQEYIELYHEAAVNSNMDDLPYYNDRAKFDGSQPDLYPNTDWHKYIVNEHANMQRHSLSLRGGKVIKYNLNLSFVDNDGAYKGRNTKKYSGSLSTVADVNKYITIRTNTQFVSDDYENTKGDFSMGDIARYPSTIVAKHSDGSYGTISGNSDWSHAGSNPVRAFEIGGNSKYNVSRLLFDLSADFKLLEGLVMTPSLSLYKRDYRGETMKNSMPDLINWITKEPMVGTGRPENYYKRKDWYERRLTLQNIIKYTKTIDRHKFDFLAGYVYEDNLYDELKAGRQGLASNDMNNINAGSTDKLKQENSGFSAEYALSSYLGRINYSFKDRYLLEANLRIDQTSRFHKDSRTGVFPAFSAGWRLSEEEFFKSLAPDFTNVKLRASWGQLGNINNVGNYDYYENVDVTTGYFFNETPAEGIREGKIANKDLTWETVTITDIGLDVGYKSGLINFVADYYYKNTDDILITLPTPIEMGLRTGQNDKQAPSINGAQVVNQGIELAISHRNRINNDFTYQVGFNYSHNFNEIKDLQSIDPIIKNKKIFKVGQSVGTFYGFKTQGLYSQEEIDKGDFVTLAGEKPTAGQVKYIDRITEDTDGDGNPDKGDGVINEKDRDYIGSDVPDVTYGMNVNVQYKNWSLDMSGQGVIGTKVYLEKESSTAFYNDGNAKKYHYKRWTENNPNPNAAYPKLTLSNPYDFEVSDYWLFKSNYFRIKNITIGYTLPESWCQKIKLQKCKLYVSADNWFTIHGDDRMKDFDPESANSRFSVPGIKTTAFGINVTL